MKCQILFSGKNKKNIIKLLSAEVAQIVVYLHNVATVITLSIGTKKKYLSRMWVQQVFRRFDPCQV